MIPAFSVICSRAGRPLLQSVEHNCFRTFVRSGRDVPVNYSVKRSFRLFPSTPTSMRDRFGRSNQKDQGSGDFSVSSLTLDPTRMAIAVGAACGLGALCYYGTRSATIESVESLSALDRASLWPDYVRQRIHATYAYLAGGAGIAAASAISLARSPAFCRVMMTSGWLAPIGLMVVTMGTGVVCQAMTYPQSGVSGKHVAWALFSACIGATLVPVCLIGGPVLTRAALYTGGIVTGLSAVALSSPSDRFLKWGGPLAIGLGVVVVSSLGSMFLSPMGRLGAGMYAISLYGGLVLFSGFLLYDTQLVVKRAEQTPPQSIFDHRAISGGLPVITPRPFDPINNSIHILLDAVNIFVRLVTIFASGGGQRRK